MRVRTLFAPYKLSLSQGSPVTLEVEVENDSGETRCYTIEVVVHSALSLGKSPYVNHGEKRTRKLRPGASERVSFRIYPKTTTRPGRYPVVLTIYEHPSDYNLVIREVRKNLLLQVV